jgi:hypothetical protein
MRLRARVRAHTGNCVDRTELVLDDGTLLVGKEMPLASFVEIVEADSEGSFFLNRYDAEGVLITETWHLSVEEAKSQAEFEYAIEEEDWKDCSGCNGPRKVNGRE